MQVLQVSKESILFSINHIAAFAIKEGITHHGVGVQGFRSKCVSEWLVKKKILPLCPYEALEDWRVEE